MFNIVIQYIKGLPISGKKKELLHIHPAIKEFLIEHGYEVDHERYHTARNRPDFTAYKGDEILIVECKGDPISPLKLYDAVEQIGDYVNSYERERTSKYQKCFNGFESYIRAIYRSGSVKGILALPFTALTDENKSLIEDIYFTLMLRGSDYFLDDLEIWSLYPLELKT